MTNTTEQDTPKKTPKKKDKGSDLPAPLLGFFGLYLGYLLRGLAIEESLPQVTFIAKVISTLIMFTGVYLLIVPPIHYINNKYRLRTKIQKKDSTEQKSD